MKLYRPPTCPKCGRTDEVRFEKTIVNLLKIAVQVTTAVVSLDVFSFTLTWRCERDETRFRASGMDE